MTKPIEEKLAKIPLINLIVKLLKKLKNFYYLLKKKSKKNLHIQTKLSYSDYSVFCMYQLLTRI